MASKKTKKKTGKKVAKKKTAKKAVAKKSPKAKRACSDCGKRGHNKRSHEPGGKLG